MEVFIGKARSGEYVFQELNQDGTIRGFNYYDLNDLSDGTTALNQSAWTHSVTLSTGKTYKSGTKAAPKRREPKAVKEAYTCDVSFCSSCGQAHAVDDSSGRWVMGDCEIFCAECITAEDMALQLSKPSDLFKARDMRQVEIPETFKEVDVLFCDSSGFGSSSERALTKTQAIEHVSQLMEQSEEALYAGLTDMGQFQVYVTIWRKAA